MENTIILIILSVLGTLGVLSAIRHFRGQGGCCGSGGYRPKKKKLKNVLYTKTFRVQGMHCKKCKFRVEEAINDLKNAAGTVNLRKGELTIRYAEDIPDDVILSRIERAGYTGIS